MKDITIKLSENGIVVKKEIHCPESWEEVSVEQYLRILKEWDGQDWVQLFSILSRLEADYIQTSTDYRLETILYQCVQFVFAKHEIENLPVPRILTLRPIWLSDCPLLVDEVVIPKHIGRLTIGQNIQARKSLEEISDIKEGISIITAIYLQPLIDKGKYDHLRAIELEQIILKMPIVKIFPIGFFLLKRLSRNGNRLTRGLNRLKQMLIKSVKTLRRPPG